MTYDQASPSTLIGYYIKDQIKIEKLIKIIKDQYQSEMTGSSIQKPMDTHRAQELVADIFKATIVEEVDILSGEEAEN